MTRHVERRFAEEYAIEVARYERRLRAWQASPGGRQPVPPRLMPVRAPLLRDVTLALNDGALLRGTYPMPCLLPEGSEPAYLAVANGLLDLDTGAVHPHTPDWFSGVCLPYPFDPGAAAPAWLAFLERNLEGDAERIALLQEFFGYCLARTTDGQACLILHGPGANGKSVVLAVLRAVLGADNVATVPLEHFAQRFAMAQTLGKLANVCPEVGELDRTAEGTLKSYISGDAMFFEKKGKDGFSAAPTARLVIATNNVPRFMDRSEGIWRRLFILPMTVRHPVRRCRAGMDKEGYWRRSGELPGVLNWALEGSAGASARTPGGSPRRPPAGPPWRSTAWNRIRPGPSSWNITRRPPTRPGRSRRRSSTWRTRSGATATATATRSATSASAGRSAACSRGPDPRWCAGRGQGVGVAGPASEPSQRRRRGNGWNGWSRIISRHPLPHNPRSGLDLRMR